jgi:hypothetical protein
LIDNPFDDGESQTMAHQILRVPLTRVDRLPWNPHHDDAHKPLPSRASSTLLSDFVRSSQPWSRERLPLPSRLRHTLWAIIPVELLWGIWLVTILSGSTQCGGPICTIATLNHHTAVLLACAAICIAGLGALAPATRWLSQCNGREVVGVATATAAGAAALLGIAALLASVVVALIVLLAFLAGFSATD